MEPTQPTTSTFFSLNWKDAAKGIVVAVVSAIIVALVGVTAQPGFDVLTANWGMIGDTMLNISLITFVAYMAKNFVSDSSGKVFGKIG